MKASDLKMMLDYGRAYEHLLGKSLYFNSRGWAKGGLCPLHGDSKEGNFHVNKESGWYNCFSCGAKGDVIQFVMKTQNCSFKEAIGKLEELL